MEAQEAPLFDKGQSTKTQLTNFPNDNFDDSGGSISSSSDNPGTLDFPDSSIMINSPVQDPSLAEGKGQEAWLKDAIIETISRFPSPWKDRKGRHDQLPKCFDSRGRIYKAYKHHEDDLRKVQRAEERASKSEQSLNVKDTLGTTRPVQVDGKPKQQEDQIARKRVQELSSEGNDTDSTHKKQRVEDNKHGGASGKRRSFKDTGGISCQPCREKERVCRGVVNRDVGPTCSPCFEAGETCPLSTGRSLRRSKADIQSESKIDSQPPIEVQPQASILLHPKESMQNKEPKSYASNDVHEEATNRGELKAGEQPQKPDQSPSILATNNIKTVQSSEVTKKLKVSNATRTSSGQKRSNRAESGANQHERYVAARSVHETLQRQLDRSATYCNTYLNNGGLCQSQPPQEDIRCNGEVCSRSWFTNEYLQKYVGISLGDAQEFRAKYGKWLCPECSHRKAQQDSRGPDVFAPACILPKYGSDFFELEDFSQSLQQFSALASQYVQKARKNTGPPSFRSQSLLAVPCIREEAADEPRHPLVGVLRQILNVDKGILVKDVVLNSQMQDVEYSEWMRAVLVYLFFNFVFNSPSPFDADQIWRDGLLHSFNSPELVDMLVQDNRIRTMTENSGSYQKRRTANREEHVRLLNAVMMPLIGGSGGKDGLHRLHAVMADIAGDLRANRCAYTGGKFEPIMPTFCEPFNSEIHEADDPTSQGVDLSNQHIMLTSMAGVKFKSWGQPDQICSKAKVRLWPELAG